MAVNIQTKDLESLYSQGKQFGAKAENTKNSIFKELKGLQGAQEALSGGQGDSAAEAIKSLANGCGAIFERIQKLTSVVDKKIEGQLELAKDSNGFANAASRSKKIPVRKG